MGDESAVLIAQRYHLAAVATTTHGLYLLSEDYLAIAITISKNVVEFELERLENQKG